MILGVSTRGSWMKLVGVLASTLGLLVTPRFLAPSLVIVLAVIATVLELLLDHPPRFG
jgi:hypothetical protein